MVEALHQTYDFVFGCWHRHLSRPFTISGKTYEVCLKCGKKFSYSLETMSLVKVPGPNYVGSSDAHEQLSLTRGR